jgi:hypothetical protein
MKDAFKIAMDDYNTSHAFKNYLKALILRAVPNLYINEFDDNMMGYAIATPEQLLNHLVTNYGQITAAELETNRERIAAPWNPDTPIETVFANGGKCRQLAVDGGDPISDASYTRILVKIFKASGVLDRAVADWERKPTGEQTVANALTHFKRENVHRHEEQKAMKSTLTAYASIGTKRDGTTTTTDWDNVYTALAKVGRGYCWSHGLCTHTSHECKSPADGHRNDASLDSMKGGKDTIKTLGYQRNVRRNNKAPPTSKSTNPPKE